MAPGDTFLIPGLDDHLWLVISDVDASGRVVIVSILSYQPHYDQACILEPGDHPFVKHSTCVEYPTARLIPLARLNAMEVAGTLRPKAAMSADLLARIRSAAAAGDINTECYATLRDQGYVP
jgi:hypothetical protein